MEFLIALVISFGIGFIIAYRDTTRRERELQNKEDEASRLHLQSEREIEELRRSTGEANKQDRDDLEKLRMNWVSEKARLIEQVKDLIKQFHSGFIKGRKWLASAFEDYIKIKDTELECSLIVKTNPAWKAAEVVKELRRSRSTMVQELKFLQYQISSYEEYFPFLKDYREAILDEVIDFRKEPLESIGEVDPALGFGYLSKEEFERLSTAERFQLALDRYWMRHKNRIEIGRLYERYIGYLYESEGWKVKYYGAIKGFEDFGRDLICSKDQRIKIIQCKCWSKVKVIREKHILQLFGTCVLYSVTEDHPNVEAEFATTTKLSEEASLVASELKVKINEKDLERYPMIKCNVNASTGEKIYHLPFDQQYDRIIIGDHPGEFYANTVEEAEKTGFRRAFRWSGGIGVSAQ